MVWDVKIVKEIIKQGKILYQCEECKMKYKDEKIAQKCEAWCKKTKSCNVDIIKYSIK